MRHLFKSLVAEFNALPGWIRKLGPWAFVAVGLTLLDSVDEFAIAIGLLAVGFVAFAVQISDWKPADQRYIAIKKLIYGLAVSGVLAFLGIVFIKRKGPKPWSNIDALNALTVSAGNAIIFAYHHIPWRFVLTAAFAGVLTWIVARAWFLAGSKSEMSGGESTRPGEEVVVVDSLRGCDDEWLHEKLKTDKATIWDLVWVASIFHRTDFDRSQPHIDFIFNIFNISLLDVVISMDGGYVLFSEDNEQFYFDPKFIAQNPARCRSRDATNFVIRQAVTRDEITSHFKSADNTRISFGNLRVSFKGTEQFPEITPTPLDVNHYLFRAEGAWRNPNRPKFLSEQESELQHVQASSGDTEWLHGIAKSQLEDINYFVVSECWVLDHELIKEPLFIDFRYRVSSSLVYSLQPIAIHGAVRFQNRRLIQNCTILESDLEAIEIGQVGGFTIRQPLTQNEAVAMLNKSGSLYFDQTFVEFDIRSPNTRTTEKLRPQGSIETQEIRAKYPRLDIQISGAYAFIVDMRDWASSTQVLITIKVDIENPRKEDIQIDNVRLATMLKTRNVVTTPRTGEIYNRQFIDKGGILRSNGEPLKNLSNENPLIILGHGKISGYFQFILEDMQVLELDDASASLTLTDRVGEQFTSSCDLISLSES